MLITPARNPSIFRRRSPIRLWYPSQHLLRLNPLPRSQFGSQGRFPRAASQRQTVVGGIPTDWRLGQDDEPVDHDAFSDSLVPRRSDITAAIVIAISRNVDDTAALISRTTACERPCARL